MQKPAFIAVCVLVLPVLADAQTFDADRTARVTVDPRGVQAGGASEAMPAPNSTTNRAVQQQVGSGGGSANDMPTNQGTPAGVLNEIPRRPVSNEGNPR